MLADVETRSVSPVFVGRADELGVLNEALARATGTPLEGAGGPGTGEPQALLLGGEAGVGKTRLIEEFTEAARQRGAVVALGGCVEIGADGLPFAPFSSALRALRRQLPDELAAAAEGQEEELARLLPELAGATTTGNGHGYGAASRSDEQDVARLFELTARLLERLSRDRAVVVVLEDLHWADASTRHLLAYLFRTLRGGRLVLIATYRADDIHRRHPLRPLLAELDRLRTVRRIELGRFSKDEVARQMAGILAAEPEQPLVDDIFDRSDGNAFFVEELAVASHGGSCASLTDSLRDLLLVRVEELPEDTQRVARIVAEGGSTVEYELLAEVAGLGEDDLIEALRAAVGANILLASPEGDGYRFRHSLVREAVSDDLLPGERSRINRRFAEALEADPSLVAADQRAARLATYWYYAHDAAKALPAVLRASVEARRRHAYAEQLRLLERAMELWDDAPDAVRDQLRPADYVEGYPAGACDPATTPLHFLDLMAEAAVAGRLCGERERALKITKRALRLLEGENDPLRSAWFWVSRSRLVSTLGRGDGWDEIARAQELMRGLPPSEVHADVLVHRASWGMLHDPGPETMAAAERAVEYARMVKSDTIELNARLTRGNLLIEAGDPETGLAEMYEVRDRVVEEGLVTDLSRAHINLPSALEGVGRSAESVKVAMEGIEFCRKYGLMDTEGWVWANAAESLLSLGRWDEAAEAVAQTHRCVQSSKPRGTAAQCSARMALFRGDHAAAVRHLQAAYHHYGSHDPQPQYILPLARIALGVAAAEGRILDAAPRSNAAWPPDFRSAPTSTAGRCSSPPPRWRPTPVACPPPSRAAPPPSNASAASPSPSPPPSRSGGPTPSGPAPNCCAPRAATAPPTGPPWSPPSNRWSGPTTSPTSACASPRPSSARTAPTSTPPPGCCVRPARWPNGSAHGQLVESITGLAQRARLTLNPTEATRAPAVPADPAEALGLTSRERDVLRLVAVGRSNRQIAEELFISPKTASVHVSNILAKLSVTGRGEAAALAHRLRLFPSGDATTAGQEVGT